MIDTAWANLNPEAAAEEAEEAEADEAEAAPVTGADLRKRLLDLIADVAVVNFRDQKEALERLNEAEALMTTW